MPMPTLPDVSDSYVRLLLLTWNESCVLVLTDIHIHSTPVSAASSPATPGAVTSEYAPAVGEYKSLV